MAENSTCWYIHIPRRSLVTSWRNIGKCEGLATDSQIAKFLINLYHQTTDQSSERYTRCIYCKHPLLLSSAAPQETHHDEQTKVKCDDSDAADNEEGTGPFIPELPTATPSMSLPVIKHEEDSDSCEEIYDLSVTFRHERTQSPNGEKPLSVIGSQTPVVQTAHFLRGQSCGDGLSQRQCISAATVNVTEKNCALVHSADTHTDRNKTEGNNCSDITNIQCLVTETGDRNSQVQHHIGEKAAEISNCKDSSSMLSESVLPVLRIKSEPNDADAPSDDLNTPGHLDSEKLNTGLEKKQPMLKKILPRSIVCSVCNATFKARKSLRSHMLIHTGEKPFPCPHCDARFRQKSGMKIHVKQVHSTDRPFQCPHCPKDFKINKSLKNHIKRHQHVPLKRPLKYKECSNSFNTSNTHQVRGKTVKVSISKDSSSAPSNKPACSVLRTMSEPNDAHAPTDDRESLEQLDSDKNISVKKERSVLKKKLPMPIVCSVCNATFTAHKSLRSHMLIHTGEKPFPCPHCDARFRQKSGMKIHVKQVHCADRPFQCPHCPKDFKLNRMLNKHIRCHQPGPLNRPFQCEECPASFTVKFNLDRHMLIHTGQKPFLCKHCGKLYSQAANLKTHIESQHLKNYKYFCEICGKGLMFYNELEKHAVVHKEKTNEAGLFTCETCGKAFKKLSSLTNHKRAHR